MKTAALFMMFFAFSACSATKETQVEDDNSALSDDAANYDQDQSKVEDSDLSGPSDEDELLPDDDIISVCGELAAIVTPYIDTTGVANKAIGMIIRVESTTLSETCTFGSLEKGGTVQPAGDELWVIGSVSKMITAHLIARKIADGELALTDNAVSHLPQEWTIPEGPGGELFTVEQLLTHTAGLPDYPITLQASLDAVAGRDDMYAAWEDYTIDDLIADLAATTITAVPGSEYSYSNLGFAIAQKVAEKGYGVSYPVIIDDFAALMGLANTTAPEELTVTQKERIFYGHGGPQLVPFLRPTITPVFTGDGFLYSDAADMGRILRIFAGLDEPPDTITTEALTLATKELFHREVGGVPVDQGLGLGVITSGDYTLYKKNGTSTGTTTAFLWDKDHHIGVVVAGNVIPFYEGVNRSVCDIFAAIALRSELTVPSEVVTACRVAF